MIKNLVISGGGLKTIPVLGSLRYLEEKKVLNHISSYFTTSAGSIYALMLILNYSIIEIENVILNFNPKKILILNSDVDNFLLNFNFYDQNKFERFIKLLISYKLGKECSNITLKQMYIKTGKLLSCATVSLKYKKIKYFSYKNQPNLPVSKLILMTCAVPLVFKPVSWRGDKYVDGGLLDNFPIFTIPLNEHDETLGIYVQTKFKKTNVNFSDLIDYLSCLLSISTLSSKRVSNYHVINIMIDEKYSTNLISTDMSLREKIKTIEKSYIETKTQYESFILNSFSVKKIIRRNSF